MISKTKKSVLKSIPPLLLLFILLIIPAPNTMPPEAWRYFAIFISMIVAMILEPIPATAISFIALTITIISAKWVLFNFEILAYHGLNITYESIKWGLSGFSNPEIWLVFSAFIFALGYETTGLGHRIALLIVKFMGKSTLALGYAIVIIDILLAPFTPSNTARTGGTLFPVIKNIPPLFNSFPKNRSSRRIGGYLMWIMIVGTSISSSIFLTGSAANIIGIELVRKATGINISWMKWFLAFLPVGILLLIIAPIISYYLYKPSITHNKEIAKWANKELSKIGKMKIKEYILIGLVLLCLSLWIFGSKIFNPTTVCLIAISLMLILNILNWDDIAKYSTAWNTLVNLSILMAMANGLAISGFLDWCASTTHIYIHSLSSTASVVVLVLIFYFSHYLFASLLAHTVTILPVILSIAKTLPEIPMNQLSILLVLSIGMMSILTPYASGPGVIIYNFGYIQSKEYWRLGLIIGVIYIATLLLIGWPILNLWQ